MQIVKYEKGQEYTPHFDWWVGKKTRWATLLMYLNDPPLSGGKTTFPQLNLDLHPGKGSAILFYSMLEDGNMDFKSLHGGLPVYTGVKWLCNLWFWYEYR